MKDKIEIICGIVGIIGGALGIFSWIHTRKESKRHFNQLTYNNHLKHKYRLCFENVRCPETDNVNMYYLWDLIDNMKGFKRDDNKFKGYMANLNFNDAFLYAEGIAFHNFTALNWFNSDTEVNNEYTIQDYKEKQIHIQRLKPFFRDFYVSVFENID
jgi:hypothetical protein